MNIRFLVTTFTLICLSIVGYSQPKAVSASQSGYVYRGILMYDAGSYNGAIDMLSHSLTMSIDDNEKEQCEFYIAKSYFAKGEYEKSINLLNNFIHDYPSSTVLEEVRASLADIYFLNGDYVNAAYAYTDVNRNAFDVKRRCEVTYRYGYSLLRLKEGYVYKGIRLTAEDVLSYREEAATLFAELDKSKEYGDASKFYKAYMDYEKNDYGYALDGFQSVGADGELGYYSQYYVCQIKYMMGEIDEVISLGSSLLSDSNDTAMKKDIVRVVGESYYRNDDDAKAIAHLSQYLEVEESPLATAKYLLGVLSSKNADYEKAVQLLGDVTEEDDELGQAAYFYLGQTYTKQGRTSLAAMAYEKAAAMNFSKEIQEEAYYNYAVSTINGGHTPFGNSTKVLETFINTFPRSKYIDEVSGYLVAAYLNGNDYEKALASISRIERPTTDVVKAKQVVLYNLGVKSLLNDNVKAAEDYLLQAHALAKYDKALDAQTSLWLGECSYRNGDYEKAAKYQNEYIRGAKSSDTNYGLGYYNYGYSRFQQRKYADARNAFVKAVNTNQLNKSLLNDANNRIGDTYYYAGQFKQAQNYYNKAAGDYALYQKAMMHGFAKEYADKVATMQQMRKRYPSSSLVVMSMYEEASAHQELNKPRKAIALYDGIVAKYPDNEYARKALLMKAIVEMNAMNEASAIEAYKDVIRRYGDSEEANVALEDLKRIFADSGRLSELSDFISTVKNAPALDIDEIDRLAFEAAEKAYIQNPDDITRLQKYEADNPEGAFVAKAKYLMISHYYDREKYAEALTLINEMNIAMADASMAEQLLSKKAVILEKNQQYADALEVYRVLDEKSTTEEGRVEAQLGAMRMARMVGDNATAEAYANKAETTGRLSSEQTNEVSFVKAEALQKQGRTDDAKDLYESLSKNVQNEYGAQSAYNLAEILYNANELSQAETTINALIEAGTPHHYWLARAFILLADVYHKQGNTFEACEYLESLKESYPGKEQDIFQMIDERLKKWKTSNKKK